MAVTAAASGVRVATVSTAVPVATPAGTAGAQATVVMWSQVPETVVRAAGRVVSAPVGPVATAWPAATAARAEPVGYCAVMVAQAVPVEMRSWMAPMAARAATVALRAGWRSRRRTALVARVARVVVVAMVRLAAWAATAAMVG